MKKTILTLAIALACYSTYAQTNTFPSSGNVGIGTTSPSFTLDVNGSTTASLFHVKNNIASSYSSTLIYGQMVQGDSPSYDLVGLYNNTNTLKYQVRGDGQVYLSGKVGVGTTTPLVKLDVNGGINIVNNDNLTWGGAYGAGIPTISANGSAGIFFYPTGSTSGVSMLISSSGNVGIGTTDPQGYKLAVNGAAIATSMKVKLYGSWPDYVFHKDYKLPTLNEVKSYIDRNQHLPDMPSEAEVIRDGINLGEIVKVQTKKIEELTLYLIEKDKAAKEQEARIANLEKALAKLTAGN
jgi:hypothetical protein